MILTILLVIMFTVNIILASIWYDHKRYDFTVTAYVQCVILAITGVPIAMVILIIQLLFEILTCFTIHEGVLILGLKHKTNDLSQNNTQEGAEEKADKVDTKGK